MASAIDATASGADANSYVTLAEANTYFGDRLHKDNWINAGASEKTAALLWAVKVLDSRVDWKGSRTTDTQALSWPRVYVPMPDPPYLPAISAPFGYPLTGYMDGAVVPDEIKYAQMELALALLGSDLTAQPDTTGLNSLGVGPIRLDFAGNNQQAETLPRNVKELVERYGSVRTARSGTRKLVRT